MGVKGLPGVQRQLARLATETERTAKSGLTKLAFEVKEGVEKHVAESFGWSGPGTEKFIAGSFRIRYGVRQGVFTALIYPMRQAAKLLARHAQRTTVTPRDRADLLEDGRMVVPMEGGPVKRGRSGKIPANLRPEKLLERDARGRNRGFIARGTLWLRQGKGRTAPAFALKEATTNPQAIDIPAAARVTAIRRAGAAFGDAVARALRRVASGGGGG